MVGVLNKDYIKASYQLELELELIRACPFLYIEQSIKSWSCPIWLWEGSENMLKWTIKRCLSIKKYFPFLKNVLRICLQSHHREQWLGGCQMKEDINLINVHCSNISHVSPQTLTSMEIWEGIGKEETCQNAAIVLLKKIKSC